MGMSQRGKNPNSLKALNEHRNRSGQRNRAAVQFSKTLRELLVAEGETSLKLDGKRYKKVQLLARKVWSEALQGKEWAVDFIATRVEGKVTDKVEVNDKSYTSYLQLIAGYVTGNPTITETQSSEGDNDHESE